MKITLEKAPAGYSNDAKYRRVLSKDVGSGRKLLGSDVERAVDITTFHVGGFYVVLSPLPTKKRLRITLEEVDTFEEATPISDDSRVRAYIRQGMNIMLNYQTKNTFVSGEHWVKITSEEVEE